MSWEIVSDVSAFIGGIRALLIQAAHPEVAAGVAQHSRYREDPLGRLGRTSAYVTATTYGALAEVEHAVAGVVRAHQGITGYSHRGVLYNASSPELLSWVHNSLVESFLTAYHCYRRPLIREEADRFVTEQCRLGALLGASEIPTSAAELAEYLGGHRLIGSSPGGLEAVEFLRSPPLPAAHRAAYKVLYAGAVATLDPRVRAVFNLRALPGAEPISRAGVAGLRAALGERGSSYLQALERCRQTPPSS
jgi:uncharacterized protein (DUF2236 family)